MRQLILFLTFFFVSSSYAERIDITSVGAKRDGKTLCTAAIQKAINKAAAAGGGTIYFPAGEYLTGGITLCDNLTIELESGANLIFSDNFDHYLPYVEMRFEGIMMKSFHPLIYATDKTNITIKGRGTLTGQGAAWWAADQKINALAKAGEIKDLNKYQKMWVESNDVEQLFADNEPNFYPTLRRCFYRPPFIQFLRCENIRIEGVTIKDSPFWTINPEFCKNIVVDGVTIINPTSPNTDGINPSSCSEVRISNCYISVGDDCVTIKSGRDAQARRYNVPCENITITNCVMHRGHGGVVIGSEMSGGVRNVAILNCIFDGTDRGIRIKSRPGRGGVIEAITVNNIIMRNIQREAIVVDLYYEGAVSTGKFDSVKTPTVKNINISSVTGYNVAQPIFIRGLPESPISNVSLSEINFTSTKANFFEHTNTIRMSNVYLNNELQTAP